MLSDPENPGPEAFGPGIYLHFPFCHARCGYCDFFTAVGPEEAQRRFVRDLAREIALAADREDFRGAQFRTVFFGGGTPSLLRGAQMRGLLRRLAGQFDLAPGAEITVECNPESISPARMEAYRAAGVNRISLGVQSMQEAELRRLDRIHGADLVRSRVRQLRRAGFANISLDLIFGLPESTDESWQRTLEEALSLEPDHLSAYLLSLEPRAPLARRMRQGGGGLPEGDRARAQYEILRERASGAGLIQYEISNFARRGFESRHNQNYWVRGEYLGLGPSAHSHRRGRRWSNAASMKGYAEAVRAGRLPREEAESAATAGNVESAGGNGTESAGADLEAAAEWIFLGLRRTAGIRWETLAMAAGTRRTSLEAKVEQIQAGGLLQRENGTLRLDPQAYFISDAVFSELMLALD